MSYLFTSESVSSGHPDKVADQISDAILDEFLTQDRNSKVACETLCTTGLVVVSGEVKSEAYVDLQKVVRKTINEIGYNKSEYQFDGNSCGVISTLHEQSSDINQGVERELEEDQGAGDQGIMFGYATNETSVYMPATVSISHLILKVLEDVRKEGKVMTYLRPDSKSQVTIEYDNNKPIRIHTIVVSTQHDDTVTVEDIKKDVKNIIIPIVINKLERNGDKCANLFDNDYLLYVNPTGKFVIGGPHGDTGLTGRKIIVDTYGGKGAHGGGAFSGKDPSKVDRSAAYAARYLAKNLVAAGVADECLIQLSYAIGVAKPLSVYVNTYGTNKTSCTDDTIAHFISTTINLTPASIIRKFGLKNPIYKPTATYGHFGRECYIKDGIEYFAWEKLDMVETFKKIFFEIK